MLFLGLLSHFLEGFNSASHYAIMIIYLRCFSSLLLHTIFSRFFTIYIHLLILFLFSSILFSLFSIFVLLPFFTSSFLFLNFIVFFLTYFFLCLFSSASSFFTSACHPFPFPDLFVCLSSFVCSSLPLVIFSPS